MTTCATLATAPKLGRFIGLFAAASNDASGSEELPRRLDTPLAQSFLGAQYVQIAPNIT